MMSMCLQEAESTLEVLMPREQLSQQDIEAIKVVLAEIKRLQADRDACVKFIETEIHWCDFRGDLMSDNASVRNARTLADFLDRDEAGNPKQAVEAGGE